MKINTKKLVTNLKGDNIKDPDDNEVTYGVALSNIIVGDKTAGKMKSIVLGTKLATAKGPIEIDEADLTLLKKSCENTEVYTNNLIPGKCLLYLESLKEEK